jgi:arabinose-5-phosphate isomerase
MVATFLLERHRYFFMPPGYTRDLGMIQNDTIICISKANSPEIKVLVPLLKRFGNTVIAITGNTGSFLQGSDFVLNTTVDSKLVQ